MPRHHRPQWCSGKYYYPKKKNLSQNSHSLSESARANVLAALDLFEARNLVILNFILIYLEYNNYFP